MAPLVAILGVGLATAWPWDRVFSDRSWLALLLLAVVVPVLIAAVGGRWRWSSLISLAAHVAAFGAVVAGLLGAVSELSEGLFGGWSLMLATTLPLDGSIDPTLLVVPTALVWLGTGVAAELAIRTELRATVLAFPLVAFAAALAQGASIDVDATQYGLGFLIAAVGWLLVRNWSLIPPEASLVAVR